MLFHELGDMLFLRDLRMRFGAHYARRRARLARSLVQLCYGEQEQSG